MQQGISALVWSLIVLALLLGCDGNDTEALSTPEASGTPTIQEGSPAAAEPVGSRTVAELEHLLDASRWTWHRNQRPDNKTFIFDAGQYRVSDWPEGFGTYKIVDGYRVELTGPNGETSEMYVAIDGNHFFLISGTGNSNATGAVRWGRRITDE